MRNFAIGIDIGGTRTKIGLVDIDGGTVEDLLVLPTEKKYPAEFQRHVGNVISILKDKASRRGMPLQGIGFGVPSFIFPDGSVDSTYGFLEFMEGYPLKDIIERQHEMPCRVDNDARCVALGEALYGKGRDYNRVLVMTLGTGLGIGMVNEGKLDGVLPYAHMGGHQTIVENDHRCYCGKTGCLESLVSAGGLMWLVQEMKLSEKYPKIKWTAEHIFRTAGEGDADALAIIQRYTSYLRTGIDNYVNLFAPQIVVLGGGVSKGLAGRPEALRSENVLSPFRNYTVAIAVSQLQEQAGILGSAALFRS